MRKLIYIIYFQLRGSSDWCEFGFGLGEVKWFGETLLNLYKRKVSHALAWPKGKFGSFFMSHCIYSYRVSLLTLYLCQSVCVIYFITWLCS